MKNNDLNQKEFDTFMSSNVKREAKEITGENIVRGKAYEVALDSRDGKLLLQDIDDIFTDELNNILSFKHNTELSKEQNYDNLLTMINKCNTTQAVKSRWLGAVRAKDDAVKKVRKHNAKNF